MADTATADSETDGDSDVGAGIIDSADNGDGRVDGEADGGDGSDGGGDDNSCNGAGTSCLDDVGGGDVVRAAAAAASTVRLSCYVRSCGESMENNSLYNAGNT